MAIFQFVHGDPLMLDYTPSGADVAAGDLVDHAGRPCIAHTDIPDGALGAVAFPCGRAVYLITEALTFESTDVDDIAAGGSLNHTGDVEEFTNTYGDATTYVGAMVNSVTAGATTDKYVIHGG